jgi:hypothetical protein
MGMNMVKMAESPKPRIPAFRHPRQSEILGITNPVMRMMGRLMYPDRSPSSALDIPSPPWDALTPPQIVVASRTPRNVKQKKAWRNRRRTRDGFVNGPGEVLRGADRAMRGGVLGEVVRGEVSEESSS